MRVEAEDVAQDEDGQLTGWQDLKGGHEGQGRWIRLLVAGLRAERQIDRTFEEGVGYGSARQPRRAGSARALIPGMSHSLASRRLAERRVLRHRLVAIR